MLRTAQPVRFVRRVRRRHRAVRPLQATFGWFVLGSVARRCDGKDSRLALDHDVPRIGCGCTHDGDALASVLFDLHADPLRACAGLAEAATREHQPRAPIGDGCLLVRTSDDAPLPAQRLKVRVSPGRLLQHLALQVTWQQCQPLQR